MLTTIDESWIKARLDDPQASAAFAEHVESSDHFGLFALIDHLGNASAAVRFASAEISLAEFVAFQRESGITEIEARFEGGLALSLLPAAPLLSDSGRAPLTPIGDTVAEVCVDVWFYIYIRHEEVVDAQVGCWEIVG